MKYLYKKLLFQRESMEFYSQAFPKKTSNPLHFVFLTFLFNIFATLTTGNENGFQRINFTKVERSERDIFT